MRARLLSPGPKKACSYRWLASHKCLNKQMHILHGNIELCVACRRREVKDGCLRCQRCLDAASLRQKRYREKKKAAKAGLGCIPSTTTPIGPGPATIPPLSLDAGVSAEAQPDIEVQYL